MIRRPSNAMKQATRPASREDYVRLVEACSKVVIRNGHGSNQWLGPPEYILVDFPYFVKFPEGFPRRNKVSRSGTVVTYKINAITLLNWLYDKGYSSYNALMLSQQNTRFKQFEGSIDRLFNILDKENDNEQI